MRIGEIQPLLRQPVDARRQPRSRPIAAHVAEAQVIGVDQDDVRRLAGAGEGPKDREADGKHDVRAGGSSAWVPRRGYSG